VDRCGRRGGLPDIHGPEVTAVGLRVPDAEDDREAPGVPEPFEAGQHRVEAERVGEVQDLRGWVREFGAGRMVGRVGIRDHGVQPVVATVQRHYDERADTPVEHRLGRLRCGAQQIGGGPGARAGRERAGADNAGGDEETAAGQDVHHVTRYSGLARPRVSRRLASRTDRSTA
jgi:hypothetical protein